MLRQSDEVEYVTPAAQNPRLPGSAALTLLLGSTRAVNAASRIFVEPLTTCWVQAAWLWSETVQ